MARIGTLVDLLLFYSLERSLFNRMVCKMGKNPHQVKRTIALWLMLEEIGYHDHLIRTIHSHDDKTIEAFFYEALRCLECIKPNNIAIEPTVFNEPINYYNREFMHKRFMHIMGTVCDKIFGERAAIEVDMSGMRPVPVMVRPIEEVSAPNYGLGPRQTNLNPEASDFYPGVQIPEDARTMFLTFSKGHPLSRHEIVNFFTSKWGEVVEDVVMEHTRRGHNPQFGRIVFTTSTVIPMVLNGHSKAKFLVNRKHLWARPYLQRHGGTGS
ncbi:hypothetical protein JRO89_XS13G0060200 [Xanthoceras sorbifolium]|uniref:Uncharacterized protein n=1 Tax=Xanthoceras sorbifolium TaxID=99658 RepID=A0ABQ8H6U8_9ROSI|nr:hypothetical protein JRO89_XS13G0060200 [Xanthoceras sorbifolium]